MLLLATTGATKAQNEFTKVEFDRTFEFDNNDENTILLLEIKTETTIKTGLKPDSGWAKYGKGWDDDSVKKVLRSYRVIAKYPVIYPKNCNECKDFMLNIYTLKYLSAYKLPNKNIFTGIIKNYDPTYTGCFTNRNAPQKDFYIKYHQKANNPYFEILYSKFDNPGTPWLRIVVFLFLMIFISWKMFPFDLVKSITDYDGVNASAKTTKINEIIGIALAALIFNTIIIGSIFWITFGISHDQTPFTPDRLAVWFARYVLIFIIMFIKNRQIIKKGLDNLEASKEIYC